jgi:hypothetical protein
VAGKVAVGRPEIGVAVAVVSVGDGRGVFVITIAPTVTDGVNVTKGGGKVGWGSGANE